MPIHLPPIALDGDPKTVTGICAPWLQEEDLAIGGFPHWEKLAEMDWHCLLLAKAAPEPPLPHRRIVLIDGTGNDAFVIRACVAWVINRWKRNQKVAVLCRSGANRAPAIAAAAWFVFGRSPSVRAALDWMRPWRLEIGEWRNTTVEVATAVRPMLMVKPEFWEDDR